MLVFQIDKLMVQVTQLRTLDMRLKSLCSATYVKVDDPKSWQLPERCVCNEFVLNVFVLKGYVPITTRAKRSSLTTFY